MKNVLLTGLVAFMVCGCNPIPLTDAQLAAKATELLNDFDALDTNADNALGLTELLDAGRLSMQTFARLDTNSDALLDRVELGEAEQDPDPALAGNWRGIPGADSIDGLVVASARFNGTRLRWGRIPIADPLNLTDVLTIDLMGRFSVDTAHAPRYIDIVFDDFDIMRPLNTAAVRAYFEERPQLLPEFLADSDAADLDTAIANHLDELENQFSWLIDQINNKTQKGLYEVIGDSLALTVGIAEEDPDDAIRPVNLDSAAQLQRIE